MRDKYARQDFNSYNLMHKPADSSLWKAIVALWPYLVDGEYWAVGKSDSVSVWYDRWISADIIKLSNTTICQKPFMSNLPNENLDPFWGLNLPDLVPYMTLTEILETIHLIISTSNKVLPQLISCP